MACQPLFKITRPSFAHPPRRKLRERYRRDLAWRDGGRKKNENTPRQQRSLTRSRCRLDEQRRIKIGERTSAVRFVRQVGHRASQNREIWSPACANLAALRRR